MCHQTIDVEVVEIAFSDWSGRVLGFCEGEAKFYTL